MMRFKSMFEFERSNQKMVNANQNWTSLNQFLIIFEKGSTLIKKSNLFLNFQTLRDSVALKTGPTSAENLWWLSW
jgi:hypothetical protein